MKSSMLVAGVGLALGLAAAGCSDEDAPTAPGVNLAPTAVITSNLSEILEGDGNSTIITMSGTDANSEVAQVTLPATGPSNVTLEVTDSRGLTDSATFRIEVT